ncbi:O-antigen ligase [Parvularcula sp. IMCC14364]|uniref:O-antigen ligase family protein n=1 Tax=Parvularcula sp. IMCC14364 TaxID=3067902 RepID=UPI0027404DE6|nr:O-antigen ligase family protein [Parvularcula sp. IMCC14364]
MTYVPHSPMNSHALPSRHLNLTLQQGRGTILDQLLVVLWLIVIPLEFPIASALRYPATALVLFATLVYWREVLPLLKRGAFFFLLPALCLLSTLWSDAAMLSIRFGAFMAVTLVICAYTAARLDYRQFVVAVFVASSLLMVGSLLFGQTTFVGGLDGGFAMIGIFPHKNVLGLRMLILIIAAIAILLDSRYAPFWRLIAPVMILPALYLLFGSNSATALVLLFAGGLLTAVVGGIWPLAARIPGLRPLLVSGSIIFVGFTGLAVANIYQVNPYTALLERLDKDTTLTGRTQIWEVGDQLIEEKPVLGLGAGAFWRPGVSQATRISTMFGAENNQFYFHNAYYEVMVHLGVVGLIVFLLTMLKAYWLLIRQWLIAPHLHDGFILTIAAILLVRSFTESELFSVFIMNPMIFWTGVFMVLLNDSKGNLKAYTTA